MKKITVKDEFGGIVVFNADESYVVPNGHLRIYNFRRNDEGMIIDRKLEVIATFAKWSYVKEEELSDN